MSGNGTEVGMAPEVPSLAPVAQSASLHSMPKLSVRSATHEGMVIIHPICFLSAYLLEKRSDSDSEVLS